MCDSRAQCQSVRSPTCEGLSSARLRRVITWRELLRRSGNRFVQGQFDGFVVVEDFEIFTVNESIRGLVWCDLYMDSPALHRQREGEPGDALG